MFDPMFNKGPRAAAFLAVIALTSACTTTGTGTGTTRDRSVTVDFAWRSESPRSGTMTATLAKTGQEFAGRFFQITSETQVDELGPLWPGWGRPGNEWLYWGPDSGSDFITHYSGRVLANLTSASGDYMRCNFRLALPSSGMAGGGLGRCQIPDGRSIDATFPPSESSHQPAAARSY